MLEERLHELAAFAFEHASCDFTFRMESIWRKALKASFFIRRSINHAGDLAPSDSASAHYARLYSDVERSLRQILASEHPRSCRDGLHLRMGGHVLKRLGEVMSAADDLLALYLHASDVDLIVAYRLFGFL